MSYTTLLFQIMNSMLITMSNIIEMGLGGHIGRIYIDKETMKDSLTNTYRYTQTNRHIQILT